MRLLKTPAAVLFQWKVNKRCHHRRCNTKPRQRYVRPQTKRLESLNWQPASGVRESICSAPSKNSSALRTFGYNPSQILIKVGIEKMIVLILPVYTKVMIRQFFKPQPSDILPFSRLVGRLRLRLRLLSKELFPSPSLAAFHPKNKWDGR